MNSLRFPIHNSGDYFRTSSVEGGKADKNDLNP